MRGLKLINPEARKKALESHLLQMRGLKPRVSLLIPYLVMSHLLQMRGLKHTKDADNRIQYQSHLLQMRGLKLRSKVLLLL